MAKGLKLKVRKFRGLTSTFAEVTEKKLVGGFFRMGILNRVNQQNQLSRGVVKKKCLENMQPKYASCSATLLKLLFGMESTFRKSFLHIFRATFT